MEVSCDSLSNEVWRPPKLGFIKLNFDATFQSNSKTSSTVVLARDSEGKVVGVETYLFTDVVDAFVVEAMACERTLFFASRMGFLCLVVKCDSMTVIKKLKAKKKDKSVLRSIISHIQMLEKYFKEVQYLFVPYRNNGAAHTLAMKGRRIQFSGLWVNGVPNSVLKIVEND
ncbi:hypothetical protein PVK06_044231 [Gossypium arboreum]|uniref:RNase H type-1 domain-containing protein n=1 Tax=Gossypium arboreum TaxID=29729 RepID=A0ABR0MR24_GOSAR|nr:hypothetical protein PVK06_044231 [Gossypium arboreum]